MPQNIGKEMVIAIPMPLVIQGDDEQVGVFEIFQGFLPGSRGVQQNSVTQGAAQAVEDGCVQQESLECFQTAVAGLLRPDSPARNGGCR